MSRYKLAHIVNPVAVGPESDLFIAQPITFASMHIAKHFANSLSDIEFYTAQHAEDRSVVPDYFKMTPDLERSVLDYGEFAVPRKLPLIKDILDRLYEASDAEYLIYTNVDITLMPNFYATVLKFIGQGLDAFVINRRTINKQYTSPSELPFMYAEIGRQHLGFDCFVFRHDRYVDFDLGRICVGAGGIGMVLAANLICFSERFVEFGGLHLTFHIGNDENWRNPSLDDYSNFNLHELRGIFQRLAPRFNTDNLPEVAQPELNQYLASLRQQPR